jgi:glutathione S-transferase
MRLYGGVHSGYTQKVRLALAEKGLTERIPFVDVPPTERDELHRRAQNPLRLVPLLELDDGSFLTESTPIIEYLEALFPAPALIPADPLRRAWMHVLDHYHDQGFTPALRRVWHGAEDSEARRDIERIFRYLETRLDPGPFLVGPLSIADLAFMARLQIMPALGLEVPADCERVVAWAARLRARPAWEATRFPPLPRPSGAGAIPAR